MTQYVTLTVDIPTDALRDIILASVNKELARPSYSTHSGSAFQVIEAAVRRVLLNEDYTALIQQYAQARLESVVDDVVTHHLRERAKAKARELARNNQLFALSPDAIKQADSSADK